MSYIFIFTELFATNKLLPAFFFRELWVKVSVSESFLPLKLNICCEKPLADITKEIKTNDNLQSHFCL